MVVSSIAVPGRAVAAADRQPGSGTAGAKVQRYLNDVSASSSTNAWGVGAIYTPAVHPVAMRWTGTGWHVARTRPQTREATSPA